MTQAWDGVEVKERCGPGGARGRGVIAMRPFASGEIVADYHGRKISAAEAAAIMDAPESDRRSDYLFVLPDNDLYMDGSAETCECHPQMRILGRLFNFAVKETPGNNLSPKFIQCKVFGQNHRIVVLVTNRPVATLEELRFDYGDSGSRSMFIN